VLRFCKSFAVALSAEPAPAGAENDSQQFEDETATDDEEEHDCEGAAAVSEAFFLVRKYRAIQQ